MAFCRLIFYIRNYTVFIDPDKIFEEKYFKNTFLSNGIGLSLKKKNRGL